VRRQQLRAPQRRAWRAPLRLLLRLRNPPPPRRARACSHATRTLHARARRALSQCFKCNAPRADGGAAYGGDAYHASAGAAAAVADSMPSAFPPPPTGCPLAVLFVHGLNRIESCRRSVRTLRLTRRAPLSRSPILPRAGRDRRHSRSRSRSRERRRSASKSRSRSPRGRSKSKSKSKSRSASPAGEKE
jgi:hypothetical protein